METQNICNIPISCSLPDSILHMMVEDFGLCSECSSKTPCDPDALCITLGSMSLVTCDLKALNSMVQADLSNPMCLFTHGCT